MPQAKRWYIGVYGGEAQARTCSPFPHEVIRDVEGDTFVLSRDHNAALAREAALQALLTAADERADRLERKAREDTTIDERDRYHEMADRLALAISNHFRVEIGEHSSMNCPWTEALNVMNGEYVTDSDHERRVGVLEGLLLQTNELLYAIQGDPGAMPSSSIDAMRGEVFTALKPAEGDRDDA